MKKNKMIKAIAFFLSFMMLITLPVEASAATKKVNTTVAYASAKKVNIGKTVVTIGSVAKTKSNLGYVRFVAPKTKTYKFTIDNVRLSSRKSSQDIIITQALFYKKSAYGKSSVTFKQNGTKAYSLYLCSAKSWSITQHYGSSKITATEAIKSRTASIRMKKGEVYYICFSNIFRDKKISYDLSIK